MDTIEFDIEFLSQKMAENPLSPLFARLADLYLQQEKNVEALKVCQDGIATYPDYYAGYVVLGKAHIALKEFSKAKEAFATALTLSPYNRTVPALLRTMEDQPDRSARTTDEDYFVPSAPAAAAAVTEENVVAADAVTAPAEESAPVFEMPTEEEMGFSGLSEAAVTAAESPEFFAPAEPGQPFPTHDEYYQQNQARIGGGETLSLDEYLDRSDAPVAPAPEPVVEPEPLREFTAEPEEVSAAGIADETVTPAVADAPAEEEPQMVFASPEQAALFAEMTGGSSAEAQPEENFDDLTERLQNAERIVPQADAVPEPPAEDPASSGSFDAGMITPTLAEIYASQGEYQAAIQAYEILMFSQPGRTAEFQQRVRELQQLKMEKDGLV